MRIFTIDVDQDHMQSKPDRFLDMPIKQKKAIRDQAKKFLHQRIDQGKKTTWELFSRDKDFRELRKRFDRHFNRKFGEGYKKYISGDWKGAEEIFGQCLKANGNDGPTLTLTGYMKELNYVAPDTWKGFRELTDK